MKKFLVIAGALAVTIGLAGCPQQQIRDLEDVPAKDPDRVSVYTNVDLYPNMVVVCVDGTAWVTTTRDYAPVQPAPGLDKTCPAYQPK